MMEISRFQTGSSETSRLPGLCHLNFVLRACFGFRASDFVLYLGGQARGLPHD
jgi:hypothetical protein